MSPFKKKIGQRSAAVTMGVRSNRTKSQDIWRQFKKNRGAVICLCVILAISLVGVLSGVIVSYDEQVTRINGATRLAKPSWEHLFGCDELGRDMFSRVVYGTRYSLLIGFLSAGLAFALGEALGVIAGYYGGAAETVIMRLTDIWSAIPMTLLAVILSSAMGMGVTSLIIALGLAAFASFARMARAGVLTVLDYDYIEAAKAAGANNPYIIVHHIIPNCMAPMIVQFTVQIASSILQAAAMSFIGLGVPIPTPEWGTLLSSGRAYIRNFPHLTIFPGLAILVTALSINIVGDGFRDALDPKLKR